LTVSISTSEALPFVGQIERAERNITVGVLADVAAALNVDPADLLRDMERLT
jgi:hypothetical protein